MQENTFLLHLFEKAVEPCLSATALIRGNTFPPSLFEKAVKPYLSATALIRGNTFSPSLFVWPRRFCYRSSAEEMWFGSAMLLRTSSGGGIELPPVGRAWATALPVAVAGQKMFCYSTDSRRPAFITRCFFVSSCGLLPPFVPPGGGRSAVAFLPPPCALTAL